MSLRRHNAVSWPHHSRVIWRYMGLDKFLGLLTSRTLFFSAAASLTDGFEGKLPNGNFIKKRKELEAGGYHDPELGVALQRFEAEHCPDLNRVFLNCWSMGTEEHYALWKIYLGGSRSGVAIRTNFSRLRKSIDSAAQSGYWNGCLFAGEVQYDNYIPEPDLDPIRVLLTKRPYYQYESELRAFITPPRESEVFVSPTRGVSVPVDLDLLVDEIYASPFAGQWFVDVLRKCIGSLAPDLTARVRSSSIKDS